MRSIFSRAETLLLLAVAGLLAVAWLGAPASQPAHYHEFADQRTLWGLPFAMDVLSNLPFAIAGLVGATLLLWLPARSLSNVQRAMAGLFFAGLLLTAVASSWYHWQPDDAGLAIDRFGMAIAFAGLLGLAAAGRVSERAGAMLGLAVLLLGPISVQAWSRTGNVLPWAALQFGGFALILWFALLRPRHASLDVRWGLVILAYAVAKLLELNDHLIFEFTNNTVSGHTLKHVVAAVAACPVIVAIWHLRHSGQNPAGVAAHRRAAAGGEGRA